MNFNPDPNKEAHEVIFSGKAKEINHPLLVFNNTSVSQSSSQKHLGVILDSKLIFDEHLKMVSLKISKTLGLLRKLHNLLPRSALITIYKAFVRPYLDCSDILYGQAYSMSFHHKLKIFKIFKIFNIFCHWNLNGLTAPDSIKISLLQPYVLQHNYDIICLSETFLNSCIESNDGRISIDGYNLIKSDHPNDSKRRYLHFRQLFNDGNLFQR